MSRPGDPRQALWRTGPVSPQGKQREAAHLTARRWALDHDCPACASPVGVEWSLVYCKRRCGWGWLTSARGQR